MDQAKHPSSQNPLDHAMIAEGLRFLCSIDEDLARLHDRNGPPPLWGREPGFPTLVHIILEQQVSLESANSAFKKLKDASPIVTPQNFVTLSDDQLKRIGFSRQKAGYCRELANVILAGKFDLEALATLDDINAREALLKMKGIGTWTADIYLLMVLLRQDIWPSTDLALISAMQEVKRLPARPSKDKMSELAMPWRPWRAVAARLLWHQYLSSRNRS